MTLVAAFVDLPRVPDQVGLGNYWCRVRYADLCTRRRKTPESENLHPEFSAILVVRYMRRSRSVLGVSALACVANAIFLAMAV